MMRILVEDEKNVAAFIKGRREACGDIADDGNKGLLMATLTDFVSLYWISCSQDKWHRIMQKPLQGGYKPILMLGGRLVKARSKDSAGLTIILQNPLLFQNCSPG
jgi:hypothetical protein